MLRTAGIVFAVVLAAQLFVTDRDNPPVTGTVDASPRVLDSLRRACFDCHSNETVWPWYSRVAPVSWLVANDVHQGRAHLNFSTWSTLPADDRRRILQRMAEVVDRGLMPPGIYTPLHPEARLSLQEIGELAAWARQTAAQP
jgi:hypothetical protein